MTVDIRSKLRLAPDVSIDPVAVSRAKKSLASVAEEGDVVLTSLYSRTTSRLLSGELGDLLTEFAEPVTIVDAVIRYAGRCEVDPELALESAYEPLVQLVSAGFLSSEDAAVPSRSEPTLAEGSALGDFVIDRCVRLLKDTEVYLARDRQGREAAIKLAGPAAPAFMQGLLRRESEILASLPAGPFPELYAHHEDEDHSWLAMQWLPGRSADSVRGKWRHDLNLRLRVGASVLSAYETLHNAGFVHGDVHPGNVLVDGEQASLVDFAVARNLEGPSHLRRAPRMNLAFYYDPEYAQALLDRKPVVQMEPVSEQFAVAAVLYRIITGESYVDFVFGRDEMLGCVLESSTRPFASVGHVPLPAIEQVVGRGLSKSSSERFGSLADLHDAYRDAMERDQHGRAGASSSKQLGYEGQILVDQLVADAGLQGVWVESGLPETPAASVNFGAAGLAWSLIQMAEHRQSAELLAAADTWATNAAGLYAGPDGFYGPDHEVSPKIVGDNSLFHTTLGLLLVEARIASSYGDWNRARAALAAYQRELRKGADQVDITLGRAGHLLGLLHFESMIPGCDITEAGAPLVADLVRQWTGSDAKDHPQLNLGIAHGWAGVAWVLMQWRRTHPDEAETEIKEMLALLAAAALGPERAHWPWYDAGQQRADTTRSMPGWCNGTTGFVFLWAEAFDHFGDAEYLELAAGAAERLVATRWNSEHLCCGAAGAGFALLRLFRATGDEQWLRHARDLASVAVGLSSRPSLRRVSLYRGSPGVINLLDAIADPDAGRMPVFEIEPSAHQLAV